MIDFNNYTIIPIQKFIVNYLLDMEIPVNIDKITHKQLKKEFYTLVNINLKILTQ